MSDSQTYLDPIPQKRRKEAQPSGHGESKDQDSTAVRRSSERKRKSAGSETSGSSYSQETTPELEGEDEDEKGYIPHIEHLSKYKSYDSAGRPTHEFSVLEPDDTIHDLKIQVKESQIPNSGMGAFLTYMGARVLTDELRHVAAEKRESRVLYTPDTMMPLDAISPDGFGVAVKLTGKNLHGNRNLQHWPETKIPLKARAPTGKTVKVNLVGDHLHCDDSEDEEEPLDFSMCPKRLGHLGTYTEKDYVSDPTIQLSSVEFSVDLGRYGPVLRKDRKLQSQYDVKNYIFGHAPAEYGMDVCRKSAAVRQVIDITDDATGTRHEAALRLPMSYINEVGHNSKLKPNVHLKEKDGRSVHYFLALSKPLKIGETVELLADYDDTYEDVRERKGYGKANIENGVKSDDHEPTALMRHFDERQHMIDQINGLSIIELFHMVEFIVENILEPIEDLIEKFLDNGEVTSQIKPTHLQWVARLRINWLGELFLTRTACLLQELPEVIPPAYPPFPQLLEQARKWAKQMQWPRLSECISSLAKRDADACKALTVASREDILYRLSKEIVKPLDEKMWCQTSIVLIKSLCADTAVSLSFKDGNRQQLLVQSYLGHAKKAERKIRAACRDCKDRDLALGTLKFISVVMKDELVNETSLKSFDGFKDSKFFQKHTTFPKGMLASLLEIHCYRDALELGFLPKQADMKLVPSSTSQGFLIVEGSCWRTGVSGEGERLRGWLSTPCRVRCEGADDKSMRSGIFYGRLFMLSTLLRKNSLPNHQPKGRSTHWRHCAGTSELTTEKLKQSST